MRLQASTAELDNVPVKADAPQKFDFLHSLITQPLPGQCTATIQHEVGMP